MLLPHGEGDEVIYVHRGSGVLRSVFGRVPFRERDYLVIPRATTHTWELDGEEHEWLCFHTPGELETPQRYRNRYGQLLEHAPFSQRDFHGPGELETFDSEGEFELTVRPRDGFQTFQGPGFVISTFAPRLLDWDPTAVTLPYHHSNIQSEEVMFYAAGDYAARKGVGVGCVTLHPSGLPHGPQPGAAERAPGTRRTDKLAIMWDTFRPLHLTPLGQAHGIPAYAYSWSEQAVEGHGVPAAS